MRWVVLVLWVAACGGSGDSPGDAGAGRDAGDASSSADASATDASAGADAGDAGGVVDPDAGEPVVLGPWPVLEVTAWPDARPTWRSIAVQDVEAQGNCTEACLPVLRREDGDVLRWLACSNAGSNTDTEYGNPSDVLFAVPDAASIIDATVRIVAIASGPDARFALSCVDSAGRSLAEILPAATWFGDGQIATRIFEVPRACFAEPVARLRFDRSGGNCLGVDAVTLNVRTATRRIPLETVEARGSCGPACIDSLRESDGDAVRWVSCTDGANTDTEYDTPTDLVFRLPDHGFIDDAAVVAEAFGSGADARHAWSCVDAGGDEIAVLDAAETHWPATREGRSLDVPAACLQDPDVRIRVARLGGNCLGVDDVFLSVRSSARSVPIRSVEARGSCGPACLDALNADDGDYLRWIACADGANTETEYDTPTDLVFSVPDFETVRDASFAFDVYASGDDADVEISCLDPNGAVLADLRAAGQRFPTTAALYTVPVPLACFASEQVRIRLARVGGNCLAADTLRLFTRSDVPADLVLNTHSLEGYADSSSVAPGEDLVLRVHAPERRFDVEVVRYGPVPAEHVDEVVDIAGRPQHFRDTAYRDGADFAPSLTWAVPALASGLYGARLTDPVGRASVVPFVVRSDAPGADAPILVVVSTNTQTAYNPWGGASLYHFGVTDPGGRPSATLAARLRPNSAAAVTADITHLAGQDRLLVEWLEEQGDAYEVATDEDVDRDPDVLGAYRVVILDAHPEYWTTAMRDGLDAFLDGGGSLLYLGGNGLYWKVTHDGPFMEVRREGAVHQQNGDTGGLWTSLGRPEAAVLGVAYDGRGYNTYHPYSVVTAGHWAFAGTGVAAGDSIGETGLNANSGSTGGASGWETDKMTGDSPAGVVLLATGTNPDGGGADMVAYDHPGGGGVFSAGSITFVGSLRIDPTLTEIVRNVLDDFLAR